jgi:hypothetical protein
MPAVRIAPFAFSDGIQLSLSDFDDPVSGRQIRPITRGVVSGDGDLPLTYDVSADPPWRKLTLGLTAQLLETELRRITPPGRDPREDVSLVVSIACPSTKYRHGVTLGMKSSGVWAGHVTLRREDIRGVVSLRPMLVLTPGTPEPSTQEGYANRGGSIIGRGGPLQLLMDASALSPMQSIVVTVWEDFSSSENSWRREHSNSLFHLEPYSERPRLFLNARFSELREILNSEAAKGAEAAVRDLTAALIAESVWVQLAVVAARAVTTGESDDTVGVTGAEWKRQLLENLLPGLYPDEPNAGERLRRVAAELEDGTGAASLISKIGTVVQDMIATHRVIEAAVRAHEGLRTGGENGE